LRSKSLLIATDVTGLQKHEQRRRHLQLKVQRRLESTESRDNYTR